MYVHLCVRVSVCATNHFSEVLMVLCHVKLENLVLTGKAGLAMLLHIDSNANTF